MRIIIQCERDGDRINSSASHCILLSSPCLHQKTKELPARTEEDPPHWSDLQGLQTCDGLVAQVPHTGTLHWKHPGGDYSRFPAGQDAVQQGGVERQGPEPHREVPQVRQRGLQGNLHHVTDRDHSQLVGNHHIGWGEVVGAQEVCYQTSQGVWIWQDWTGDCHSGGGRGIGEAPQLQAG